jgi:hypothetical protein
MNAIDVNVQVRAFLVVSFCSVRADAQRAALRGCVEPVDTSCQVIGRTKTAFDSAIFGNLNKCTVNPIPAFLYAMVIYRGVFYAATLAEYFVAALSNKADFSCRSVRKWWFGAVFFKSLNAVVSELQLAKIRRIRTSSVAQHPCLE